MLLLTAVIPFRQLLEGATMTYAGDRILYDADTHIMELPDFLRKFADPDIREELPLVSYGRSIVTDEEVDVIMANGARHSDEHKNSLIALGDRMITEVKEIQALGSFDKHDRVIANDMLGFIKQLVFATHSLHMPFSPSAKISDRLRYGGARAHNRHMIDFCSVDDRLMGVAAIPLENPELALEEVTFALEGGLQAMWVPHRLLVTARQLMLITAPFGRCCKKLKFLLSFTLAETHFNFRRHGATLAAELRATGWVAVRTFVHVMLLYYTRELRHLSACLCWMESSKSSQD
jgi:hypothetical protein